MFSLLKDAKSLFVPACKLFLLNSPPCQMYLPLQPLTTNYLRSESSWLRLDRLVAWRDTLRFPAAPSPTRAGPLRGRRLWLAAQVIRSLDAPTGCSFCSPLCLVAMVLEITAQRWRVSGGTPVQSVEVRCDSAASWPPQPLLSALPASPPETQRVMGPGTGGAALAGAFAGGLCGLLVSCYWPVRLTKQGPVKLSRGWISEMCIQTQRRDALGRSEQNQDEETTGANVDAKWEWQ